MRLSQEASRCGHKRAGAEFAPTHQVAGTVAYSSQVQAYSGLLHFSQV